MALLQGDKAIFYHPLDDADESIKGQTWAGCGSFVSGKVSNGLAGIAGTTMAFGGASVWQASDAVFDTDEMELGTLDSTHVVLAYRDVANSSRGVAVRTPVPINNRSIATPVCKNAPAWR